MFISQKSFQLKAFGTFLIPIPSWKSNFFVALHYLNSNFEKIISLIGSNTSTHLENSI
jgi:hypothetical protein